MNLTTHHKAFNIHHNKMNGERITYSHHGQDFSEDDDEGVGAEYESILFFLPNENEILLRFWGS